MPLLIFHCRTRLFLAFIQQRTKSGGTRTLYFNITVAGTVNDFHIIPHHDSTYFFIIKYEYRCQCLQLYDVTN